MLLFVCATTIALHAQITFNGCPDNLKTSEDNSTNYTLNNTGTITDSGVVRNTYESSGYPNCPSGVCNVRIIWNTVNTRWEIQLDPGNDPANYEFTLYYNTTAAYPNPPDLTLGTWVENTADTSNSCGGTLTSANGILSGDVQSDVTLSVTAFLDKHVKIYPNPASKFLVIQQNNAIKIKSVAIINVLGKQVLNTTAYGKINVENLPKGLYFATVDTDEGTLVKKVIID